MYDEEFRTAISECYTDCAVCGASALNPDQTNLDGEAESVRCSCGAVVCNELVNGCWDPRTLSCGAPQCDRMASRIDQ